MLNCFFNDVRQRSSLLYVIVYLDVDKALQVGPVYQPPLIEQKFPDTQIIHLIHKFPKNKDAFRRIIEECEKVVFLLPI
jgi:hypothetical protein